ncbi:MAG: hypothetical protein HZB38_10660 [Planctomycetes bacterium]|nr:hypothetical protein [Planctomycetota bacterium]
MTGALRRILYDDQDVTPDVEFAYRRSGELDWARQFTSQGEIEKRTFDYDPLGLAESELFNSGPLAGKLLSTDYQDAVGAATFPRLEAVQFGTSATPDALYSAGYDYDAATGLLSRVSGPGLPDNGANYSYLPNSPLLERTTFKDASQTVIAEWTRSYEPNRSVLTRLSNVASALASPLSQYDYASDALGRRKWTVRSGAAFDGVNSHALPHYDAYTYDSRGELTASTRYRNNAPPSTDLPAPAKNRTYAYDEIGNRTSTLEGTTRNGTWNANELNQIDTYLVANPSSGRVFTYDDDGNITESLITGDINNDGQVSLDDLSAFMPMFGLYCGGHPGISDEMFARADMDADCDVDMEDMNVLLSMFGVSDNGTLRSKYAWDAENRLTHVEPMLSPPLDGNKKIDFVYDFLGRRTEKKVSTYSAATTSWSVTSHSRFVYFGWNPILEFDLLGGAGVPPEYPVLRKFTWGLDLGSVGPASGRSPLGSAGGIGGLLASLDTAGTTAPGSGPGGVPTADDRSFLFAYDGGGNVMQLLETTGGPGGVNPQSPPDPSYQTIAARYEYDPFGNPAFDPLDATRSGPYAGTNAFRFSTKPFDAETGLSYYGYRYYSPAMGRWMNRDPLGEAGGLNLYGFVGNSPIDDVDPLGEEVRQRYITCTDRLVIQNEYVDSFGNSCGIEVCNIPNNTPSAKAMEASAEATCIQKYQPWYDKVIQFEEGVDNACTNTLGGAVDAVRHPIATCGAIADACASQYGAFRDAGDGPILAGIETFGAGGSRLVAFDACWNVCEGRDDQGKTLSPTDYGANCFQIGATYLPIAIKGVKAASGCSAKPPATIGFLREVARRAEQKIPGKGGRVGALRHSYCKKLIERYQDRYGQIGEGLQLELSYCDGDRATYGTRGSVRLDVVEGNPNCPKAVYDFKFGDACLKECRIAEIRRVTKFECPILEIKP